MNKGVTLIALIITIIVLLILAGITIAMVVGDNGIIAKAGNAKKVTDDTQQQELDQLKDYEEKIETLERTLNGVNIKEKLDSATVFGGSGTSFSGFIEGHKYLALYISNQWDYGDSQAHINTGATDIHVIAGGGVSPRNGIWGLGAMLTFTATNTDISITWENQQDLFKMYFIDIT